MTISPRPPLRTHEQVLQALADEINISDAAFEKAKRRYLSIGEHLDREGSSLSGFSPVIHPQGSLLLGTCIKPVGDEDHYDVDLVCLLEAMKTQHTQKDLKERVGHELKLYVQMHAMKHRPHRGRRCWKIEYAEGDKFHLDVLPAIPDESGYRGLMLRQGRSSVIGGKDIADLAVAITDEEHPGFDRLSADWNVSNPKGYAAWFQAWQAEESLRRRDEAVRRGIVASIDELPEHRVRTPLQCAIQLLKRHRDAMFDGDPLKPISVIITTLAAQAYRGERTITEALETILRNMPDGMESSQGAWVIRNPVNPAENFADRWADDPQLEANFFEWLETARRDFGRYLRASPYNRLPEGLRLRLTPTTAAKVEERLASVLAAPAVAASAVAAEAGEVGSREAPTKPWRG